LAVPRALRDTGSRPTPTPYGAPLLPRAPVTLTSDLTGLGG
jgi:hypothetical protein